MYRKLIGAVIGLALAGMAATAAPAPRYRLDYTGNNFTSATGPYTTDMSISGWVIIPFALPVGDVVLRSCHRFAGRDRPQRKGRPEGRPYRVRHNADSVPLCPASWKFRAPSELDQ